MHVILNRHIHIGLQPPVRTGLRRGPLSVSHKYYEPEAGFVIFSIAGDRLAELHVRPIGLMFIDCAFVQICASNQCTLNTLFKYMADPDLGISRGPPELVKIAALCMNCCGHCHCVHEVYFFNDVPTQMNS